MNRILFTYSSNDSGPVVCQPLAQGVSVYHIVAHEEFLVLEHQSSLQGSRDQEYGTSKHYALQVVVWSAKLIIKLFIES